VELLFGSDALSNGTVFNYYSVLEAQIDAERMAKAKGYPFSKKQPSSKRKPFYRR
jgi:hypothetical protein